MLLEGACHCRSVRFSVHSNEPYPYMYCYCSICRKTAGGGGYAINLSADAEILQIQGEEHLSIYQVKLDDEELSPAKRHFCSRCGSALWAWDSRWPELLHPFASAIDTPLPKAPERCHIMLDYAPDWVPVASGDQNARFSEYPDQSIHDWHQSRGLLRED
jgi:hypothetical protein